MRMNRFLFVLLALAPIITDSKKVKVNRRSEFVKIFSKCRKSDPSFDDCVKDALNEVRPYFKYGVPEFNIPPFDPFFAEEVIQTRGGASVNFKLTLRNVYESGWTESKVYRFKSDLKNGIIRYFQFFPAKFLQGEWEFESNFMGPYSNSGTFDLSLYNYTQVTTARAKRGYDSDPYTPFAVRIQAIDAGDMELHISNLFNGVSSVEFFLDRIINMSWRPGFMLLKPLIDDLVSSAFTKIFNDAFRNFPFEQVFYKSAFAKREDMHIQQPDLSNRVLIMAMKKLALEAATEKGAGEGAHTKPDLEDLPTEMDRGRILSNLLQCATCGIIFEAPAQLFEAVLKHKTLRRPIRDCDLQCPKCTLHSPRRKVSFNYFQTLLTMCKNRANGCTAELPSCEMGQHQTVCEYRPVRCIWYLQCEQKEISFREYRKHLEEMHWPYIKMVRLNEPYEVVIKNLKDHNVKVSAVLCDEREQLYFTRRCSIDLQQNLFMVCAHYIGNRENARKFVYTVRINQGLHPLQTFYEYSNFCAPCVETPNAPEAHAQCFILQPKKLFLTDEYLYELKYTVTIKRVKDS